MTIFVGVDPGATGGIAWVDGSGYPNVIKMPATETDIFQAIKGIAGHDLRVQAMIERVASRPGQSSPAMWKFSGNYHGLRMALIACGIGFEAVPPGVWQRAMGCLTKGNKNVTKARAQELWPGLKITHAFADALLLMEYARRRYS